MKGASGADLSFRGDFVLKQCSDAEDQVAWFKKVESQRLIEPLTTPRVSLETPSSYLIEYIEGHVATHESGLGVVQALFKQVMAWSSNASISRGNWDSYLTRLEDHVRVGPSGEMVCAMVEMERCEPFPSSFCHGDLTLENALVQNRTDRLFLIDPNSKPSLFSSFILDLGKLLQSTYIDYHAMFDSHCGVELTRHNEWLVAELKKQNIFRSTHFALISHIMRLRKYRPSSEHETVDYLLNYLLSI